MSGVGREPPTADRGVLAGRRVVVTGDARRVADLGARVATRGADVVELVVVAVADPADGGAALDVAAGRLVAGAYDWVAVTSAHGAERLGVALGGRPVPPGVRGAAVGPSTRRALERAGLRGDLVPERSSAEALGEALLGGSAPGRLLYPRAQRVRGDLAGSLRAAGWDVDEVVAYRTAPTVPGPDTLSAARGADAVLFTSGSAVDEAVERLGADDLPALVVTLGPATSAAARGAGLEVAAEAVRPSGPAIVDALVEAVGAASGSSEG